MIERFPAGRSATFSGGSRFWPAARSAGLAHDFRNMLQIASSGIELARRRTREIGDVELDSGLAHVLDALERANLLAHRVISSALQESRQPIVLHKLILDLKPLLRSALGPKIGLESLVSEDLPPIFCDRLQMETVLLNLAINGARAMPEGGTLTIEALGCALPKHRQCIALSVADTGCGMSRDVADAAFQPYFSTRPLNEGTGLGLFNVRSFAERLGGTVQLFTQKDRGTRIVLHLPGAGSTSRPNQ